MENEPIKTNESIKLSKMSKGYNWEIRVLPMLQANEIEKKEDRDKVDKELIERLEKLNNEMVTRFGDGKEN